MEYLYGILGALVGLFLIMAVRSVTTFFHEIGHAIPALLYTQSDVSIYVGTYGDISKSLFLRYGRLKMYLKLNLFNWQKGVCHHQSARERWQKAIIILGGPIASVLISIPLIYLMTTLPKNGIAFSLCAIFIAGAFIDLVANLIPNTKPIELHDGNITVNDGTQLLLLIEESKLPDQFFELDELLNQGKYQEVVEQCDLILDTNPKELFAYEMMIEALLAQEEYERVIQVYSYQKQFIQFTDEDYFNIGKAYKQADKPEEAMKFFEKYYYKNYTNKELINEMSEVELTLGRPQKAIDRLTPVIKNYPTFHRSYVNMSRAYTSLKDYPSAIKAIDFAEKLNDQDPLLYYYKGRLYEKTNQHMIARRSLERAIELGYNTPSLRLMLENLS